jgi:uncharacterized RDD family membrane protein YckC
MAWLLDAQTVETTLASRRIRLGVFLFDQTLAATMLVVARSFAHNALGVLAYIAMGGLNVAQIILLGTRGQTIGKMILNIDVVDHIDKMPPGFVRAALIRQLPIMIVGLFAPALTLVYLILDGAPIFTSSRRCLHDYLAGTVVITLIPDTAAPSMRSTAFNAPSDTVAPSPIGTQYVFCWSCKHMLPLTAENRGTTMKCPGCGTSQRLPR